MTALQSYSDMLSSSRERSSLQGLPQVGDQILRILQPDAHPYHPFIDSGAAQFFGAVAGVAEEDGQRGERLSASQAGRAGDELQAIPEPERFLARADRERHHSPE